MTIDAARDSAGYSTADLAAASGYSAQQIRKLEHLGVLPPATRQHNGYRRFTVAHLTALRAYRRLAIAVGPVVARTTMSGIRQLPADDAIGRIIALHAELARDRENTNAALDALSRIVQEGAHEALPAPSDSMSITELSAALGVPSSTLRFWEHQRLLAPERDGPRTARRYAPGAVREARIVAALRAGGYRIPAIQAVIGSLRSLGEPAEARDALEGRLTTIAARSVALLRAGSDLAELLSAPAVTEAAVDDG